MDTNNNTLEKKDVIDAFAMIRKSAVNLKDLDEFRLNNQQKELCNKMTNTIVSRFKKNNQEINEKHKQYISDILTILLDGQASITSDLIPLTMGGGKSLIVEEYLIYMLKNNPTFGAIVVKERNTDLVSFANAINKHFNMDVVYTMHGFGYLDCQANEKSCTFNQCTFRQGCKYANQLDESKKYPVVGITHSRLSIDNEREKLAENYATFYKRDNAIYRRSKLLVDERPVLVFKGSITNEKLAHYCEEILVNLGDYFETEISKEFKLALHLVEKLFQLPQDKKTIRQPIMPIDNNFKFSDEFWKKIRQQYDLSHDCYKIPSILESIIHYGGHREVLVRNEKKQDKVSKIKYSVAVHTTHNLKNKYSADFHAVVFDGTADIDLSYRHDKYRMFNFESIRTYEGLSFYMCDNVKSSKSALESDEMLESLCLEAMKISDKHPNSRIYMPVYKEFKNFVTDFLSDYIKTNKIKVAHFGSTKGSNEFIDCDIILLGGIMHKTENHYIGLNNAISDSVSSNIECCMHDGRRYFINSDIEKLKICDMLVDCTQEIKRIKQRDNSRNVFGKVYVFTDNELLLSLLPTKFPASKVEKWNPMEIYDTKMKQKRKHSQVVNEPILYDYLKSVESKVVYMSDIMRATGLPKDVLSKKLNTPMVKAVISDRGYDLQQNPNDKRQKMYVRKEHIV